ncbi:MAG: stage II sporulation protein M [Firmicutes bacterium]|jgi:stage II sporulation protein M|nr:stage II sporulation protein M [Bacillota bacterium]
MRSEVDLTVFQLFMPFGAVIRENKNWLVLAAAIFIMSALLVYNLALSGRDTLGQYFDLQSEQLQELLNLILNAPPFIAALMIFINNFISLAQMLFFGALAGVSPLLTLALNGALLGFTSAAASASGVALVPLLTLGILPHGIFELPAFILCGALGLKFGYHCVASPLPGMSRLQSFKYIWKEAISVLPVVVLLLLAAAFIEILITPQLLAMFTDTI